MGMKKVLTIILLMALTMMISGCDGERVTTVAKSCDHDYHIENHVAPTCSSKGATTYKCRECGDEYVEAMEIVSGSHRSSEITVLKEPTLTESGTGLSVCELCGVAYERYIREVGDQKSNPYVVSSSKLWKSVRNNGSDDYVGKYIQVSGKVKRVSHYSDANGYYLEGDEVGSGVICWVYERSQSLQKGDEATFLGKVVVNNGQTSIEITCCEVIK